MGHAVQCGSHCGNTEITVEDLQCGGAGTATV